MPSYRGGALTRADAESFCRKLILNMAAAAAIDTSAQHSTACQGVYVVIRAFFFAVNVCKPVTRITPKKTLHDLTFFLYTRLP